MLAAIEAGGRLEVELIDLDAARAPLVFRRSFGDEARAYVFYDRRSFAELGLEPGMLAPAPAGRALPSFERRFGAIARAGSPGEWAPLAELPPSIAALRLEPPKDACAPLQLETLTLVEGATRAIGAPVDDSSALIAFPFQHRLFRLYLDGRVEELTPPIPDFHPIEAFGLGDGTVWFAENDVLRRWTATGGFDEPHRDPTPGASHRWIDGSKDELFTSGWNGPFTRFDGTRFEQLGHANQDDGVFGGANGGVAWTAPGEATAIFRSSNAIYRTRIRDEWPVIDRGLYTAIARIDGFGLLIATNLNRLYAERAGVWEELPYGPLDTRGKINTIAALPPRSLLIGGLRDFLVEYDREAGFCEVIELGRGLDVRKIFAVGPARIAIGADGPLVIIRR